MVLHRQLLREQLQNISVQKLRRDQQGLPRPKAVATSIVSGVGLAELLQEMDVQVIVSSPPPPAPSVPHSSLQVVWCRERIFVLEVMHLGFSTPFPSHVIR